MWNTGKIRARTLVLRERSFVHGRGVRELPPEERSDAQPAFESYLDGIPPGKRFGGNTCHRKDLVAAAVRVTGRRCRSGQIPASGPARGVHDRGQRHRRRACLGRGSAGDGDQAPSRAAGLSQPPLPAAAIGELVDLLLDEQPRLPKADTVAVVARHTGNR